MNYQKYNIPEYTLSQIRERYVGGTTIARLRDIYGYPYSAISYYLKGLRIGYHNTLEKGMESIKKAEEQLIGGSFPDYTFNYNVESEREMKKYRSLLNYYAKADLNGKLF